MGHDIFRTVHRSRSDQSEVCMSIFICKHVLLGDGTCQFSYAQEINFFHTIDLKNTFLLAKG
jgi:hypothetical protein